MIKNDVMARIIREAVWPTNPLAEMCRRYPGFARQLWSAATYVAPGQSSVGAGDQR